MMAFCQLWVLNLNTFFSKGKAWTQLLLDVPYLCLHAKCRYTSQIRLFFVGQNANNFFSVMTYLTRLQFPLWTASKLWKRSIFCWFSFWGMWWVLFGVLFVWIIFLLLSLFFAFSPPAGSLYMVGYLIARKHRILNIIKTSKIFQAQKEQPKGKEQTSAI